MGNIIALELAYHQHPPEDTTSHNFWFFFAIITLTIFIGALMLFGIFIFRKFFRRLPLPTNSSNQPNPENEPDRPYSPSSIPTVYVILILTLVFLSQTEAHPKGKMGKGGILKPMAKGSLPIIGTSALYFGMDALFGKNEEENSVHPSLALFAFIGFVTLFVLLIIIKIVNYLRHYLSHIASNPHDPIPHNSQPPGSIELGEIRNTINDLINRADPPRANRFDPSL
ncbi:hypothetical protein niasHT_001664 [Heterodera trifolii]|uniref:Uncharacterized protein n=1 Tax=Heterodera trifolii TaxID=157864 RepID=A0ABD2M6U3_9BILA